MSRFQSFSVDAVAAAGLLDGINPCAFTTIVFLLSMLSYLGKNRRQLAVVGIGFTVAVFVTYFLLGLGFLGAIKAFSVSHGISSGLTYAVAFLAFALAGWSLLDFVRYIRTGSVKSVTLGLPKSVKTKIHKVIRTGLTTRGLYGARPVKSKIWFDWFNPLFGFPQPFLFVYNLRPIKLYDDTHSDERAFKPRITCELSSGQIKANFKLKQSQYFKNLHNPL